MRRLADTLPTLRDAAPAAAAPATLPAATRIDRFDAPPASKIPPRPALASPDAFDVAALRSSLLKRREPAVPLAGAQPAAKPAPFVTSRAPAAPAAATIPPLDGPRVDVEAKIAAAVAAARLECEKEKTEAVEFARKVERDVAARALAEAREGWVRDEAAVLRDGLAEVAEALHVRLSDAFGRVLAPFAAAAVRDVAVRRFAATLDDLVGAAPAAAPVLVRGPADLVCACRALMGETAARFEEAATPDLVADLGDTRLETTLAAFAETLAETLAPPPPAAPVAHDPAPAPHAAAVSEEG